MSGDETIRHLRRERRYRLGLFGVAVALGVAAIVYGTTHHTGSRAAVTSGSGPTANAAARDAVRAQGVDPSSMLAYTHYLYFSTERDANAAAAALRADLTVEASPPGGGVEQWAVLASQTAALDASALDVLTGRLEGIAADAHGIYDGWEVGVGSATTTPPTNGSPSTT